MKKGDWVLCPQTKDNLDEPNIVAKIVSIEGNIINIAVSNGIVPIPKKWCRVVTVIQ